MNFPRYQYRLPDGQLLETGDLRRLKRQHPDATIVARVDLNELGYAELKPYRGEQPEEQAQELAVTLEDNEPNKTEGATAKVALESPKRDRKKS